MPTEQEAIVAMKTVADPELQLDIWTLGLIYEKEIKDSETISIKMTFTSPMCPYGPMIVTELKNKLEAIGFKIVDIEVVFNPLWEPSEEVKTILGIN
ncbi:metal-sulfur cluster assembly factor [Candidatus Woesearchaeota archaeon]|nr:metal-sulfur cluster assembly factor [Candidatus Woesearchaeota archaeon]